MRCIFCNGVSGNLKVLTEAALKNVCQTSVERRDDIHHRLDVNSLSEYRIHVKCRASYISKSSIVKRVANLHNNDTGFVHDVDAFKKEGAVHHDASDFNFESCCLICNKSVLKVVRQ